MSRMNKLIGALCVTLAPAVAMAGPVAPEIDPGPAVSALTLATGFVWVAMSRKRSQ